jgi:hypothetical protein
VRLIPLFLQGLARIKDMQRGILHIHTSSYDVQGYSAELPPEFILQIAQKADAIRNQQVMPKYVIKVNVATQTDIEEAKKQPVQQVQPPLSDEVLQAISNNAHQPNIGEEFKAEEFQINLTGDTPETFH